MNATSPLKYKYHHSHSFKLNNLTNKFILIELNPVRLHRCPIWDQQRSLCMVEWQNRKSEIFLVGQQQQHPHLSMRNRSKLCWKFYAVQLRFQSTSTICRQRYSIWITMLTHRNNNKNNDSAGIITDKSVLPITRLNFGRTILEYSSGVHTLGRFECSGQVVVEGMASSCEDLWRIGHTLSGLYSVMGVAKVENIYCDFTKLPNDAGILYSYFQVLQWIWEI